MTQSVQTMKKLTKIKLVNWHYFSNETISVNGSFLISGENASGKSTILDAIQLVLTTNTRRFNPAANERSKRDLKGYVRCKTGEEGNTYHRTGSVISYVALEFYEEAKDKFFVLGVKLDSPDLEGDIKKKWFCEEGILDSLSFIVDNKPAFDDQFKNNGRKISLIHSQSEAKSRFKRRLGNLDDTFFDMIPKSLAFKPMDDVKSFINKFILPEKQVDVDTLRENIRNLREMQKLIEEVKRQIDQLNAILDKYNELKETDKEILIIDILIKIAELEAKKEYLNKTVSSYEEYKQNLRTKTIALDAENDSHIREEDQLREVELAIRTSEHTQMIENLKNDLKVLEEKKKPIEEKYSELKRQIGYAISAIKCFGDISVQLTAQDIRSIENESVTMEERNSVLMTFNKTITSERQKLYAEGADIRARVNELEKLRAKLSSEIDNLKRNRLIYPENTIRLKDAIEKEFENRKIDSCVRIFADLLEILDPQWQNAVEGYLNTQRFNIIVEPQYYDVAAEVYDRVKKQIHSVALVNTQTLDLNKEVSDDSLAAVIKSENGYATAYAAYLMGRVIRCENVEALKNYPIAITCSCMLYQSKALRKIDEAVYRVPYIGKFALKRQLELKQEEYLMQEKELQRLNERNKNISNVLCIIEKCNIDTMASCVSAPDNLRDIEKEIKHIRLELKDAESNPNIIALQFKADEIRKRIAKVENNISLLNESIFNLKRNIKESEQKINTENEEISRIEKEISLLGLNSGGALEAAKQKFDEHKRTKAAGTIYENYQPRRTALKNQREKKYGNLTALQALYKNGEFGTGEDTMSVYEDEFDTLSRHDLIEYEERLRSAKIACEQQFRESFLAKMRENIEQAEDIFKSLNRALKSIYYGNDSYKFHLSANKLKQGLYEMITSDVNLGGMTLFSNLFEEKYRTEMDDLFSKLTESDVTGDSVLKEYIDYRSYLDYDIEIISNTGKSQFFSKIYGEKSGGETQTPYYVAIAASFYQIYSLGESIRIIMLDEAFDKMDDDRIVSMMKFFHTQNFQIILATPPAKMEVIGEHVDTILMTYRQGYSSTVEEFTYEEL